ncbi:MAG: hypothetical protein WBW84_03195 [Acidobacteriaceae bacterium]
MHRKIMLVLIAAVFCAPLLTTGCAGHRYYYDSYTHQRYPYAEENSYYVQWEGETHRHHKDFNKRSQSDQKAYWDWRNKNGNKNNKGHDHDHDQHSH